MAYEVRGCCADETRMMSCLDNRRGFGDDGWVNYEVRIGGLVGRRDMRFA
jgi:hypothetical protein